MNSAARACSSLKAASAKGSATFGGMLVPLLSRDMPASSTITRELLGWQPTHPGLIEDIDQDHYFT